jgi:hypothetical protein
MNILLTTQKVKEVLDNFPAATMDISKKKQETAAWKASEAVYKGYSPVKSVIWDIENSYILACNEVVVDHLIGEVRLLKMRMDHLTDLYLGVNSNHHINMHSKGVLPYLKTNKLLDFLIHDIKVLGESFGFSVDVKDIVNKFKGGLYED